MASGVTVLVVDDDGDIRRAMERILDKGGYFVVTAGDGPEAVTIGKMADRPIDLLLTDVKMPGGIDAARMAHLLTDLHPDLRVVFVSGLPKQVAVAEGLVPPDATLVEKPFTPVRLIDAVETALATEPVVRPAVPLA